MNDSADDANSTFQNVWQANCFIGVARSGGKERVLRACKARVRWAS